MPSCRNDDWIKNLYELRSRVYPSVNYLDHQRREVTTLAPSVGTFFTLIQSLKKMATPSRSRSSGREEDDNFEWRLAIERRQLASERQLKALLQETERLREENAVLRIQASTSGPQRRQRSRGQVANSRPQQEPESIYPGTTGAIPGARYARPHEPSTPMPRAPREESSDSTHFSAKRQRDKKSQLSNSMQTRLGPQVWTRIFHVRPHSIGETRFLLVKN
ncbi:hypothetical protein VitviT2T_014926 [Vitis vinifera]|uniref:Uncharacterized protein n=1 Tax=Vitis vinifera TaxID=29760 RepID=A0ABY9CNG3_VITVI|nr:hypothetical protein VitviT2T_014926 [Vitis vinifera]